MIKIKLLTSLVGNLVVALGLWKFDLRFLEGLFGMAAVLSFVAFLLYWMDEGNKGMYD
jgi:hypothetical protein